MLTFLILLILAWSFYIGYARGIILQSYYFLVTLVALLIAGGSYKGLAKVLSLWVPFSSPTQQSVNYFYANRYLFQLDDIFYAGLAYVLIFAMIYLIGRVIGIFMHSARKTGGSQVSNWSGCDRRRDNSLGHPDGLDCPLNGSHGFHPK